MSEGDEDDLHSYASNNFADISQYQNTDVDSVSLLEEVRLRKILETSQNCVICPFVQVHSVLS